MQISCELLLENVPTWSVVEKEVLLNRLRGKAFINIMDVYKLFMPSHFRKILRKGNMAEIADKWENYRHSDEVLESTSQNGTHEMYVGLEDKALKAVLAGH